MDIWKYFAVTHKNHVFCNPVDGARIDSLCERLSPYLANARVLEIACGKAELLVRLAERFGITGIGVDASPHFIGDARQKAARRVPGTHLEFVLCDGKDYRPDPPELFGATVCMGASWIFNGHRGTLRALSSMTRAGGLVLVGEPFWLKLPDPEYLVREEVSADAFSTHHGNVVIGEDLGLRALYAMTSTNDEFDAYEGLQWIAARRFAVEHPEDPDLPEILARADESRDRYLRWGRDTLGWGMYAFLKP